MSKTGLRTINNQTLGVGYRTKADLARLETPNMFLNFTLSENKIKAGVGPVKAGVGVGPTKVPVKRKISENTGSGKHKKT